MLEIIIWNLIERIVVAQGAKLADNILASAKRALRDVRTPVLTAGGALSPEVTESLAAIPGWTHSMAASLLTSVASLDLDPVSGVGRMTVRNGPAAYRPRNDIAWDVVI